MIYDDGCCNGNVDRPTEVGFLTFIRTQMQINTTVLPDNSPYIHDSYCAARQIVNIAFAQVSCLIYKLMVYNLAGSNLINFAQDVSGQTFFADLRKKWNLLDFVPGVINSTSDQSTSESLTVPENLTQLTLADLQYLKDPYGRVYLQYAMRYGTLWGLT